MQMRSVWFTKPRGVELRCEEVRAPGPGELLIEAIVSLISAGTEMLVYRGELVTERELMLDRPGRAGAFPFPVKYGYQVVGRVIETGPGVLLPVGTVVFAAHPHQERFVLPWRENGDGPHYVYPVLAGLGPERAAFTNLFGVALNALLDAPVRIGDCVAVSGLGVVGMFLAQLARRTAHRLILIEPAAERRRLAAGIGADAVVAPEDASAAVTELSEGRGADICFEASGAPAALQTALTVTGQDGLVAVVSYYGGRPVNLIMSPEFHYRRLTVMSSQAGRINPGLTPRWNHLRRVAMSMASLRDLPLDFVSHRFELSAAAEAYRLIDTGGDDVRGVLLTYGG